MEADWRVGLFRVLEYLDYRSLTYQWYEGACFHFSTPNTPVCLMASQINIYS